jgi:hypothetical protein
MAVDDVDYKEWLADGRMGTLVTEVEAKRAQMAKDLCNLQLTPEDLLQLTYQMQGVNMVSEYLTWQHDLARGVAHEGRDYDPPAAQE